MKKVVVVISALALLLSSALFAAPASASEAEEVSAIGVSDSLNRSESPLGGNWTALGWTTGTVPTGVDTTSGWGPTNAHPNVSGAYWYAQSSDAGGGDAAGLTLNVSPSLEERYVSVWLNMPTPGGAKSGYQLRWIQNPSGGTYTVKLSKWVSGTETVLASEPSVSIPSGTRMMISDSGNTITAWKGTTSPLTAILSASDSTYSSGYAGIEASGNFSRSLDFRLSSYSKAKITGLPVLDNLQRDERPLSFGGKWSKPAAAENIGGAWASSGWLGYGSWGGVFSSAYWNPTTFSDTGEGVGVAATLTVGPGNGEWMAVNLNGNNLGEAGAQTKYEARWTGTTTAGTYTLELSKVASGTRTVLASRSATIGVGQTIALTEKQGGLMVWAGNPPVPMLVASDSSFTGGYAGISAYGGAPTADNFQAGVLSLGPSKPTVASTTPASPANDNSPEVKGDAPAGTTVQIFTNSSCSGSPVASGSASTYVSPGITVSVADNTTTTFYANATNSNGTSPCSTTSATYIEDSTAPAEPTVSSTSPASPANNNSPKVIGSAEAGSTVKLYTNKACSTLAASGTASAFASPGIAVSVADNTTTTFYATATDAAGNVSSCSTTSVAYTEDSTAPAAPTVSSTNPASGSNNNEPKVIGSAESGSTVKLYTNSTCTSSVAATGTAAAFASPGLTVSVADNTTTTFYATATDAAGNASACSTTSVKYEEATPKIYWGAWMGGNAYGSEYGDGPWDSKTWNLYEEHTGKKVSIVHFGQPAPWNQAFAEAPLKLTRERGALPLMDMDADEATLKEVAEGKKDSYFKTWATAVKNYGYPFFFRWEWEMNGTWFPWGKEAASNPTLYKEAWWHLHKLFEEQGAANITWVWCPNLTFPGSTSLSSLYPGNEYVDWTCLDGYNFGTNPAQPDSWKSFSTLYKTSYEELLALAPSKPIMIGEMASTEYGGEKSAWITDAIGTQIPKNFPKIKAIAWYNKWDGGRDWPIETSASAQAAFKNAIAAPIYATNSFGSPTKLTKIEPLP